MNNPVVVKMLATAVLSAMVFGACGGGLSKEEYIEQADEICQDAQDEFNEMEQPQSLDELEPFVNEARDRTEELIGKLRDLEPPEEIADQAETMLDNLDEAVGRFPDLLDAAEDQDVEEIQAINADIQENVDAANEAAQDIGLEECGDTGPTG